VSPKGDVAGFVVVEDSTTLLIPDRPGNRLMFGIQNIFENPQVGLCFEIPGTCEWIVHTRSFICCASVFAPENL
jgi:predicted pyridoxine 5'-phosphate oxidase superfamily flavin-nucleotide-binding protein